MFVLQWPGGLCYPDMNQRTNKILGNQVTECRQNSLTPNQFYIHGRWSFQEFESDERLSLVDLDDKERDSLVEFERYKQLTLLKLDDDSFNEAGQMWGGFLDDNHSFIKYELSKHASRWNPKSANAELVASSYIKRQIEMLQALDNDLLLRYKSYLNIAVHIAEVINLFQLLQQNNITPRHKKPYKSIAIKKVIDDHFQIDNVVILICRKVENQKNVIIDILIEVKFCQDNVFNFVSCEGHEAKHSKNICGKNIYYMPIIEKYINNS
jgi:hypothetical protein